MVNIQYPYVDVLLLFTCQLYSVIQRKLVESKRCFNIKSNQCKKIEQKTHKRMYSQVLFDIIDFENFLIIDNEISN